MGHPVFPRVFLQNQCFFCSNLWKASSNFVLLGLTHQHERFLDSGTEKQIRGKNNSKKKVTKIQISWDFSKYFCGFWDFFWWFLRFFWDFWDFFEIFEIFSQIFKISLKNMTEIFYELFAPLTNLQNKSSAMWIICMVITSSSTLL